MFGRFRFLNYPNKKGRHLCRPRHLDNIKNRILAFNILLSEGRSIKDVLHTRFCIGIRNMLHQFHVFNIAHKIRVVELSREEIFISIVKIIKTPAKYEIKSFEIYCTKYHSAAFLDR
jgi:hypothetical protein